MSVLNNPALFASFSLLISLMRASGPAFREGLKQWFSLVLISSMLSTYLTRMKKHASTYLFYV